MLKNIFLFPGQGAQEVGMGGDLFRQDDYFLSLIDKATQYTGEDLKKICLKGPERKLIQVRYLQPLIVAVSLGYLRRLQERDIKADLVLGHSLGEITALAAAGIINDNTAIIVSAKRGQLMDEAASLCDGAMMAVLSIAADDVKKLISELGLKEKAAIANDNSPEQIVLSGDKSGLDMLSVKISEKGGKCRRLNVSGPWHSPHLKDACNKFAEWVETIEFKKPHTPILFNANAQVESDPQVIKEVITRQLSSPVYFRQCMRYCKSQGVGSFFEVGPGRVLSGLVRENGFMRGVNVYNINNLRGIELAVSDFSNNFNQKATESTYLNG